MMRFLRVTVGIHCAVALLLGFSCVTSLASSSPSDNAQVPGTASEPIRVIAKAKPEMKFHDAALPPVVGVHNIQVMRANRTHPNAEGADGLGWTYSHAPMLCYWNGKFYVEYLSNPVGEHIAPGQTLLVESADGHNWSRPRVVFPSYKVSEELGMSVSHQRMAFYIALDGRLLLLSFYGYAPKVNDGKGVGRAVRELHEDGTLGPIYFIRYNRHAGFDEENTPYPFYKTAEDKGFVAACDALLADKLMTQQWWEEDRSDDGFYAISGGQRGFDAKALSFFHRKDGAVVGLWKKRWAALSFDEGKSWTQPIRVPSLVTGGAKTWGQRTEDGRYAMVFNPHMASRWPLVLVSGSDGIIFDDMHVVHGEIPYPRYDGHWKSMGPQYVRGIAEGNGNPPRSDLWLTYSVNKEDIWVSRVPVPIRGTFNQAVNDDFDNLEPGRFVTGWNVYSPIWAPVALVPTPDNQDGNCIELRDEDRYDYAKAVRVFPAAANVTLRFRIRADEIGDGLPHVDVLDRHGARPVRLSLSNEGQLLAQDRAEATELVKLTSPKVNQWLDIELQVNAAQQSFTVLVDGKPVLEDAAFAEEGIETVERLCFRTGEFRDYDAHAADLLIDNAELGDRLDGDTKVRLTAFFVDDVRSQ